MQIGDFLQVKETINKRFRMRTVFKVQIKANHDLVEHNGKINYEALRNTKDQSTYLRLLLTADKHFKILWV